MSRDLIEYVPRERLDRMASHVLRLSNSLSLVLFLLVVSLCGNAWQAAGAPRYSDAQRARLTAFIAHLIGRH